MFPVKTTSFYVSCGDRIRISLPFTIYEMLSQASENGSRFTQVVLTVGSALQNQINTDNIQSEMSSGRSARELIRTKEYLQARCQVDRIQSWSPTNTAKIGGWLVNLFLNSTTFSNGRTRPFRHCYQTFQGKRFGMIMAHPNLLDDMDMSRIAQEGFHSKHMPMVVPPQPWKGVWDGPYLLSSPPLVRSATCSHIDLLRKSDLDLVLKALTAISATPWKINTRIMEIASSTETSELLSQEEPNETKKRILMTASKFSREPNIYFPHNMDFRGRCYPIPSSLNHMGSDLCRGVLQFSNGKPLGT